MAPTGPESVLRKRRRDEDWAAKRAAASTEVSHLLELGIVKGVWHAYLDVETLVLDGQHSRNVNTCCNLTRVSFF